MYDLASSAKASLLNDLMSSPSGGEGALVIFEAEGAWPPRRPPG